MHPTPGETTDEQKAECERLHIRHDELVNMDEDEWTDELAAEGESIETRIAEIQAAVESRAVFRPEDIAVSDCIATVSSEGRLKLDQGLVRPEDMPAKDPGGANAAEQDDSGGDEAGVASVQAGQTAGLPPRAAGGPAATASPPCRRGRPNPAGAAASRPTSFQHSASLTACRSATPASLVPSPFPPRLQGSSSVAEAGKIAPAADRLAIGQPALTRAIAALESRFGAPLFERLPTGVRPTTLGVVAAKQARRRRRAYEEAEDRIGDRILTATSPTGRYDPASWSRRSTT